MKIKKIKKIKKLKKLKKAKIYGKLIREWSNNSEDNTKIDATCSFIYGLVINLFMRVICGYMRAVVRSNPLRSTSEHIFVCPLTVVFGLFSDFFILHFIFYSYFSSLSSRLCSASSIFLTLFSPHIFPSDLRSCACLEFLRELPRLSILMPNRNYREQKRKEKL